MRATAAIGVAVGAGLSLGAAGCAAAGDPLFDVEQTPPAVVETVPADGADAVDPAGELRVRFDRPMGPETLAAGIVLRSGAAFAETEVLYVPERYEALVLPRAPLAERLLYRLEVGPPIRSAIGVEMAAPVMIELTTGFLEP